MNSRALRLWAPGLGIVALVALFLSLPEIPSMFGVLGCQTCSSRTPYLPLIGAGYFATLAAVALLFPSFPAPLVARGGLTWAILLAAAMTYIKLPDWCPVCIAAHSCNIFMWAIWVAIPSAAAGSALSTRRERLCLALLAPVCVIALFSSMNLTFMAYGIKLRTVSASSLRPGDPAPVFSAQTSSGQVIANSDAGAGQGIVINFVSPDCPFCNEQLPLVNSVASQLDKSRVRFINVSRALFPELVGRSPSAEWIEDKDGKLRELFGVSGYPTLFIIDADSKISNVIPGVPDQLEANLLNLAKQQPDEPTSADGEP